MENPPKNLIFPGIVSPERMRELYALANLFLLPSYNELFPMTILEAASCEAPIMLRDLDLYKVILEGDYRATADREEMKEAILEYQANPAALKDLKEKAKNISMHAVRIAAGGRFPAHARLALLEPPARPLARLVVAHSRLPF